MVDILADIGCSSPVRCLKLAPKVHLFNQGEPLHDAYILREGWIQLERTGEDGERQVFRPVLPGEHLGFQPEVVGEAMYSAVALVDSEVCVTPSLVAMSLSHPKLALRLAWATACDMMLTEMYLVNIMHRSARERIAFMALELFRRFKFRGLGQDFRIPFPMRQEDIADLLGLTPTHVNRTLHGLREEGVLIIRRHELRILDYVGLCAIVNCEMSPLAACDLTAW